MLEASSYQSNIANASSELIDEQIAPKPKTITETGLSESLLLELITKHLFNGGVLTKEQLVKRLCVSGGIVQELLSESKKLSWVENRQSTLDGQMRYALSAAGEIHAKQAFSKNGYVGPAPIPLTQYSKVCLKQTSRGKSITLGMLQEGLKQLILPKDLIHKIGPALNSNKPVLIYGPPGTGKSYLCRHLNLILGDLVLIPYAISINNEVIQVFDPELHHRAEDTMLSPSLKLQDGYDPRWIKCKRPLRITGGELTAQMLEVQFDNHSRTYMAPLQLKANNGILLLDDLGRQKISAKQLFNRWIIPMEERRDFLALQTGEHFEIPFELVLLFSTNLEPKELVDEAFLRRLGYKIHFDALNEELYKKVWFQVCDELEVKCDEQMFKHVIQDYHHQNNKPLMPCYPRDILSIVADQIKFLQLSPHVTPELIKTAWSTYFV